MQNISLNCISCGSTTASVIIMPPYHTHYAALKCGKCDCFIRWVPKLETEQKRKQQQQKITSLLESPKLSSWEQEFLTSVGEQKKLSPKQQEILNRIEVKVGGAV